MKSPNAKVVTIPDIQMGYIRFLKCASTTISESIKERYPSAYEAGKQEFVNVHNYPVVSMWRCPYARIESAYRYFRMPKRKGFRNLGPDFPSLATFDKFVIDICMWDDERRDLHFRTQTACEDGLNIAERVAWDFDAIEIAFGLTLKPRNPSPTYYVKWTREITELFEQAYADDLTMWERIS